MEAVTVADVVRERSHVIEDVALAARCAATTVLITADSPAGVERIARQIHATSRGAAAPFVRAAAAALPVDAAVLARTCADLLDAARGGSLLLSDVEQMPAIVQDRWIETVARLQASPELPGRVRFLAGTTTILHARVAAGTFSERLFYRLNAIHVVARNGAGSGDSVDLAG